MPARGRLIVQAVVVALMTLVAIVASVVQGAVVLPLTGLLGGLLPWRDLRRQRASRPAVGPRPTWAVDEGGHGVTSVLLVGGIAGAFAAARPVDVSRA